MGRVHTCACLGGVGMSEERVFALFGGCGAGLQFVHLFND